MSSTVIPSCWWRSTTLCLGRSPRSLVSGGGAPVGAPLAALTPGEFAHGSTDTCLNWDGTHAASSRNIGVTREGSPPRATAGLPTRLRSSSISSLSGTAALFGASRPIGYSAHGSSSGCTTRRYRVRSMPPSRLQLGSSSARYFDSKRTASSLGWLWCTSQSTTPNGTGPLRRRPDRADRASGPASDHSAERTKP